MTKDLRLLNKLTGEINTYTVNPDDPDSLANAEVEARAFIEEIENFRAEIKKLADDYMAKNDYKPVEVMGGAQQWVHRAPQRVVYSFNTARSLIDEDMLLSAGAVTLQTGKLKALIADLVDRGEAPAGFWDEMEKTAERKAAKPYVMLERLK